MRKGDSVEFDHSIGEGRADDDRKFFLTPLPLVDGGPEIWGQRAEEEKKIY